jgi:hypothetical protein
VNAKVTIRLSKFPGVATEMSLVVCAHALADKVTAQTKAIFAILNIIESPLKY